MTKTEIQGESQKTEPIGPRERKARNILWVALVVGAVLGAYFGINSDTSTEILFSNDPIDNSMAIVGIGTWLVIVPILTWMWWRTIDEHEADAYREGALISAHAYIFLVPAWWFAARAGWVPDQDPMIVLLIISVVWSLVWLYRKYA